MARAKNIRFNDAPDALTWHADHIEKTTADEKDFMVEWNFKVAPILRELMEKK